MAAAAIVAYVGGEGLGDGLGDGLRLRPSALLEIRRMQLATRANVERAERDDILLVINCLYDMYEGQLVIWIMWIRLSRSVADVADNQWDHDVRSVWSELAPYRIFQIVQDVSHVVT